METVVGMTAIAVALLLSAWERLVPPLALVS